MPAHRKAPHTPQRQQYDADYESSRHAQGLGTITFRPTHDDMDVFDWLQEVTGDNRATIMRKALNVYCQILEGQWVSRHEHLAAVQRASSTSKAHVNANLATLLPKLIRLCHPDKHNGSQLATDVTQTLLALRREVSK